MGGLHIDEKIVGLSISQWLPCPLAIWNLLFGMAILLNLVKHDIKLDTFTEKSFPIWDHASVRLPVVLQTNVGHNNFRYV